MGAKASKADVALAQGAYDGHLPTMQAALAEGADVNAAVRQSSLQEPVVLPGTASTRHTPLVLAILRLQEAAVTLLLKAGADVNARGDRSGWHPASAVMVSTPLSQADQETALRILAALLDAGSDPSQTSPSRMTALHWACSHMRPDCALALLRHPRCPPGLEHMRDSRKSTALHAACFSQRPAIVRELLQRGANPCLRGSLGETPLLQACNSGANPDIVWALLQAGAGAVVDVPRKALPASPAVTPLLAACSHASAAAVTDLLQAGASLQHPKVAGEVYEAVLRPASVRGLLGGHSRTSLDAKGQALGALMQHGAPIPWAMLPDVFTTVVQARMAPFACALLHATTLPGIGRQVLHDALETTLQQVIIRGAHDPDMSFEGWLLLALTTACDRTTAQLAAAMGGVCVFPPAVKGAPETLPPAPTFDILCSQARDSPQDAEEVQRRRRAVLSFLRSARFIDALPMASRAAQNDRRTLSNADLQTLALVLAFHRTSAEGSELPEALHPALPYARWEVRRRLVLTRRLR